MFLVEVWWPNPSFLAWCFAAVCPMGKGSVAVAQRKAAAAGGTPAGEPTLVVGPEVVGRKIMLFTKAANDFLPGAITGFNPKDGASCGHVAASDDPCVDYKQERIVLRVSCNGVCSISTNARTFGMLVDQPHS